MNWLALTKEITLDVNEPNLEDRTFLIPCFVELEPLVESIRRVGIINPPVLQDHPSKGIVPVLGRRRLEAARRIGVQEVQARIIPPQMTEPDGFALAFWDNHAHRAFTDAIKAFVVRRLLELYSVDRVARDFLPILGEPPKGPRLQRLRAIGELGDYILQALAEGRLHEKTAWVLSSMEPQDRGMVVALMGRLGVNANKAAELITHLHDLCVYHGRSVAEILSQEPAPSILADDDVPVPEQAARFRELVRSWKFPELVLREQEFARWRTSLDLPANISIRAAREFETDECSVEIVALRREDAEMLLEQLKHRGQVGQ
jgi:ParB family chromosome partitioning protein